MKHQIKILALFVLAVALTLLTVWLFSAQIQRLASSLAEFPLTSKITLWVSLGALYFDLLVLGTEYLLPNR